MFVLFEVGAEQVPLRNIRETTLYRADVFFSPSSSISPSRSLSLSGPLCARWSRAAEAAEARPGGMDGEREKEREGERREITAEGQN